MYSPILRLTSLLFTGLCFIVSAHAVEPCTVEYDGSFLMPSPEASYTAYSLCFVPDGTPRLGSPVTGPSLVGGWDARADYGPNPGSTRRVMELTIPPLSKTAGSLSNATYVGTAFNVPTSPGNQNGPHDTDSAGNFWGPNSGNHGGTGLKSNPGAWKAGGTGDVTIAVQETGWAGTDWTAWGTLRRGDGQKHGLPLNGTNDNATFVISDRNGLLYQNTRSGDGGSMTTTTLFQPTYTNGTIGIWNDYGWMVQYIKDTTGHDWFVVLRPGQNGTPPDYRSSMLLFYRGNTCDGGGTPRSPFFVVDIDSAIRDGAGYAYITGQGPGNAANIRGIASDWETGTLYILDTTGYANSRVHVFTAEGAPPRGTVVLFR